MTAILLVVMGKALTALPALPIVTPGTGVAAGIVIEIAVESVTVTKIATETAIETGIATVAVITTVIEIAIETRTGIVTGIEIEIGIETASTKARGFTTLRTMGAIDTVPTPMNGVTAMACLPAPMTGGAIKTMIRSVHTSTNTATPVSFRSSVPATRTGRPTGTVFCVVIRKASRTGKGTFSAEVFIDSFYGHCASSARPRELTSGTHLETIASSD
jgi:hypothetical protein